MLSTYSPVGIGLSVREASELLSHHINCSD